MVCQTFRTTTPRLIGIELDLVKLKLNFWINGKPLPKFTLGVPSGKQWVPAIMVNEIGLEVTLNPYCSTSEKDLSNRLIFREDKELNSDETLGS